MTISQTELKRFLSYDPKTGMFTRRIGSGTARIGDEAGCIRSDGYRIISVGGISYLAHRLAWLHVYGSMPKNDTDHIDRNRGNNAIDNLRDISHSANLHNSKRYKNNKSGLRGACWIEGRKMWLSSITSSGRNVFIGYFGSKREAAEAYKIKASQIYVA